MNIIFALLAELINLNVSHSEALRILNKVLEAAGHEELKDYEMFGYATSIKNSSDGLYGVSHKELNEWLRK